MDGQSVLAVKNPVVRLTPEGDGAVNVDRYVFFFAILPIADNLAIPFTPYFLRPMNAARAAGLVTPLRFDSFSLRASNRLTASSYLLFPVNDTSPSTV